MSLAIWFWLLFLLWVLSAGYYGYRNASGAWFWAGPWLVELLMWLVVGIKIFGSPVQG